MELVLNKISGWFWDYIFAPLFVVMVMLVGLVGTAIVVTAIGSLFYGIWELFEKAWL